MEKNVIQAASSRDAASDRTQSSTESDQSILINPNFLRLKYQETSAVDGGRRIPQEESAVDIDLSVSWRLQSSFWRVTVRPISINTTCAARPLLS